MALSIEQQRVIALARARQRQSQTQATAEDLPVDPDLPDLTQQTRPSIQPQQQEATPGNLLAEGVTAANRGVSGIADVLLSPINVGLQLAGSDRRVGLSDLPGVPEIPEPGAFAGSGLMSQIAQGIGGTIPGVIAGGAALRSAVSLFPAEALSESALLGTARALGRSTVGQDVAAGALSGAGTPIGGQAGENIGGDTGRQAGELVGGVAAPFAAAIPTALKNLTKKVFAGGEAGFNTIRESLLDFAEIGDTPTLGTAAQNNLISTIENRSKQIFGGAPLTRAFDRVSGSMQKRVSEIADDLSKVSGDVEVGRVIQKGIQGEGGFIDRSLNKSGRLWQNFDNFVSDDAPVVATNTARILDDLVNTTEFGPVLNNPVLTGIRDTLGRTNGEIDYRTFRSLRSAIGEKLGGNELVSDVPKAQLKRLYGALSEDLRGVARASGAPEIRPGLNEAEQALNRANRFTSAFHGRIEDFVERTTNKVDLDKVFNAIAKGGEGTQAINAIKRSLKPEEWEAVAANTIRRLGRATPGQQDAGGEVFSIGKLLTDWNKLGPAKKAIFSGSPRLNAYKANLDRIASAADRFKEAAKEGANPSGTAQAAANITLAGALAGSAFSGSPLAFATIIGAIGTNSAAARLMSSPTFVKWVAQGTSSNAQPAAIIASLNKVAEQTGEDEAIQELIEDIRGSSQPDQPGI